MREFLRFVAANSAPKPGAKDAQHRKHDHSHRGKGGDGGRGSASPQARAQAAQAQAQAQTPTQAQTRAGVDVGDLVFDALDDPGFGPSVMDSKG